MGKCYSNPLFFSPPIFESPYYKRPLQYKVVSNLVSRYPAQKMEEYDDENGIPGPFHVKHLDHMGKQLAYLVGIETSQFTIKEQQEDDLINFVRVCQVQQSFKEEGQLFNEIILKQIVRPSTDSEFVDMRGQSCSFEYWEYERKYVPFDEQEWTEVNPFPF
mmetsp:Transcript_11054/g.18487  ORF Transcript_11054/g.18487 Transcript_11054/m.18487 type:complete len:161 (-) Transcript_11054:875-1357(-)